MKSIIPQRSYGLPNEKLEIHFVPAIKSAFLKFPLRFELTFAMKTLVHAYSIQKKKTVFQLKKKICLADLVHSSTVEFSRLSSFLGMGKLIEPSKYVFLWKID